MPSSGLILRPLDAAHLLRHGLLIPGPTPHTQRLHKRRLNCYSDAEYAHLSLPAPPAESPATSDAAHSTLALPIPAGSPEASDAFATLPTALVSCETLTFVGLSAAKLAELWERWANWPASGPLRETDIPDGRLQMTFREFILGGFNIQVNAYEDDDIQWRACLDAHGVDAGLQDAIMDPRFKYIRLTASCLFHIKDCIEMRYAGLEEIQRSSRTRETELQQMGARQGGHRGGGDGSGQGQSGAQSSPRPVSGVRQHSAPGLQTDLWNSASAVAARNAPGHTILFRGMDQARLNGEDGLSGLFDAAGNVDRFEVLLRSTRPSDFSAVTSSSRYYFTPDPKAAERDAADAKSCIGCLAAAIVCLRIPHAALAALPPQAIQHLYYPDPAWKELVFRCRRGERPLPPHLQKYTRALLIIGTASTRPRCGYASLDSWEDVADSWLLRVDGKGAPAIQYAFAGDDDGLEFLLGKGGGDVTVFAFPLGEREAGREAGREEQRAF